MNKIIQQQALLDEIAQILHNEADDGYEKVSCKFEWIPDYATINLSFHFMISEESIRRHISTANDIRVFDLAEELRAVMKSHTGGEWTSFTLTLDKNGKAHTKFEYPNRA